MESFIFEEGIWLGEGKISLSTARESIKFYTKWVITKIDATLMQAIQTVEMQGVEEQVKNQFLFSEITASKFVVNVKNQIIPSTIGTGIRDDKIIAWEFPLESPMHGFEVYEVQSNGDFSFHAEYGGKGEFISSIEGLIWKKVL